VRTVKQHTGVVAYSCNPATRRHETVVCDRPKTGAVADCMRRTRAAYHNSICKVKRDEDKIINERLAESLLNNGARDVWSEIKHIRSSKTGISCSVDGHTEATSIAKLYKYRDLYTSVPYDVNEMQHIH